MATKRIVLEVDGKMISAKVTLCPAKYARGAERWLPRGGVNGAPTGGNGDGIIPTAFRPDHRVYGPKWPAKMFD